MQETPILQLPFPERTDKPDGAGQIEALAMALDSMPGQKVTIGKFADGPPADPRNGDIWIATDVTAGDGVTWQFFYDAASTSPRKWAFVGGPPVIIPVPNGNGINGGGVWGNVGGGYVTGRPGDWFVQAAVYGINQTGVTPVGFHMGIGVTTGAVVRLLAGTHADAGLSWAISGFDWLGNVPAGVQLWVNAMQGSGTPQGPPGACQFSCLPIRVS